MKSFVNMLALLLVLASCTVRETQALELPPYWASSMVLQRGVNLTLWGIDTPGSTVTATWHAEKFTSKPAAADGRFEIALPASNVSVIPTTLQLQSSSGEALTLEDIVVGDVYVCSGQSNSPFHQCSP